MEKERYGASPSFPSSPVRYRSGSRSPAAGGVLLILGQSVAVNADHRIPKVFANLCQHLGVVEMRHRLHDRPRALGGVAALENTLLGTAKFNVY